LSELSSGEAAARTVNGRRVVVVRLDDDVFVLDDCCSHEDFPLSEGLVDESSKEIECSRHGAMFSLVDGSAASLPATQPVSTYAVSVVGDVVSVELS
jgi:3-phenylpropionate/trans-cinnamate dioxygenase ferredoxin subunit